MPLSPPAPASSSSALAVLHTVSLVSDENVRRKLVVVAGTPAEELERAVAAAFEWHAAKGIRDAKGRTYVALQMLRASKYYPPRFFLRPSVGVRPHAYFFCLQLYLSLSMYIYICNMYMLHIRKRN